MRPLTALSPRPVTMFSSGAAANRCTVPKDSVLCTERSISDHLLTIDRDYFGLNEARVAK